MTTELERTSVSPNEIDPEALVQSLTTQNGLPEQALRKCQQHRELVTPYLIRCIEQASATVRAGGELETDAPWLAYYLLWEFQAKEALPAILAAASGEDGYKILGDSITEDLDHVLATLAGDNLEAIDAYISNRDNDPYSRSAAANSYRCLVRDGVLTRAAAVQRLAGHLRAEFDRRDDVFAGFLVCTLCDLFPKEALEDIRAAFAQNVINASIIGLHHVERAIAGGEVELQRKQARLAPTHLDDAVELIRDFPVFLPESDESYDDAHWTTSSDDYLNARKNSYDNDDRPLPSNSGTIRNDAPRIGRNDPCPCGSGKKYKKCCLRESTL